MVEQLHALVDRPFATTHGKNVTPRVAALLDVAQISDVLSVQGNKTYTRPTYAGNVIATVTSSDAIQVLTVRSTAFDTAPDRGRRRRSGPRPHPARRSRTDQVGAA